MLILIQSKDNTYFSFFLPLSPINSHILRIFAIVNGILNPVLTAKFRTVMIEYTVIGFLLIGLGITARTCPDGITNFYIFLSRIPMKKERWQRVWRFLGKYLIGGGILLILAGIYLRLTGYSF